MNEERKKKETDEQHYSVEIESFNQEHKIRGKYIEVTLLGWERNKEIKCTCKTYKDEICSYKKKKLQLNPSPETFECSILKVKVENISSQLISVTFGSGGQMIDSKGKTHEPTYFCDELYPRDWKHYCSDLYDGTHANFYLILPELEDGVDIKRFIYRQDIFEPGSTCGWVQDHEAFDFRLKNI